MRALAAAAVLAVLAAGCGGEEAGRAMDDAARSVRDRAEEAAEAAEDHVDRIQQSVDEAAGAVEDRMDDLEESVPGS